MNSNFEDEYVKKTTEKLFNEKKLENIQIPDIILENILLIINTIYYIC